MSGAIKGYADSKKSDEGNPQYATINPVREQQYGLDVIAHAFAQVIGSDAVEAGSTTRVINATGHSARKGDVISFTTGDLAAVEARVASVTADTITLSEELSEAPAAADQFNILRQKTPTVTDDGSVIVLAALSFDDNTQFPIDAVRLDHTVDPVTTGAWVLLSTPSRNVNFISVFSSSGRTLELAMGSPEVLVAYIPPGGFDAGLPIRLDAGEPVSVRAVGSNATTGELQVNFLGASPP